MKKVLVAILAVVYLISSAGATVHTHYCMGKVYAVNFMKAKDECSKCGMKKSANHCCSDELKTLKLTSSYNAVSNNINLSTPVFAIIDKTPAYNCPDIVFAAHLFAGNNSPPPVSPTSLHVFNCVFRI